MFAVRQTIQLRRRIAMRLLAFALALLTSALPSHGQYTTGTVRGTVSDPSGAVIPGAEIKAKNLETNQVHTTTTTSAGTYSVNALQPGMYEVTVHATGFE